MSVMDQKFKDDWVKALRSGEFEQCRDDLADGYRFCCIGVGYQVSGRDCDEISEEDDPTAKAASTLGLPNDITDRLIAMNDKEKMSFSEIADYIEREIQ